MSGRAGGLAPGVDPVLACYAELAETVARMTGLAREGRWQDLPALDGRCGDVVERLRALYAAGTASAEPARVAAIAGSVRAAQDELQRLLQPQFLHLARRIAELNASS